jgi:hypothetical protein
MKNLEQNSSSSSFSSFSFWKCQSRTVRGSTAQQSRTGGVLSPDADYQSPSRWGHLQWRSEGDRGLGTFRRLENAARTMGAMVLTFDQKMRK